VAALLSLASATAARADEDQAPNTPRGRGGAAAGRVYTVRPGDTLSEIADRLEVSRGELERWNPDLDPDRIRPGQELRVYGGRRRVLHTVRQGETLARIAARYEVDIDALLRWNPGLSRDLIRAGRELAIYTEVPASRSKSIGAPQRGRLEDARRLPTRHPALYVRRPSRAWGTDETVRWIVEAYEDLREEDPAAPRVEVHDLSLRRGGPMRGHNSHESGRDADIAYFQQRCPRGICRFRRIRPEQLDAQRQWRLFRRWLEAERVEAIFVDHDLQRALYRAAREDGVSRADLNRWFQYPRAPENRQGVIRHHPRHADHFHVRFVCHETDEECR
jgi:LysM repeat protein